MEKWEIDKDDKLTVMSVNEGVIIEGNIVCFAPEGFEQSMKNWEVNSKLIACSPEMLEALKESVRLLCGTTEFEVIESYRKKVDDFEKLIQKATE